MTARFMSDTPYAGAEQEMQRIPGFHPSGTGMAVSRFQYSVKDCDCRLCAYKSKKRKCKKADGCICLRERLVAGCVPFEELLERFDSRGKCQPVCKPCGPFISTGSSLLFLCWSQRTV